MKFDRFDFEQDLMKCWSITDDLKLLTEAVLEKELTRDQISNILIGMTELYELRFDKLFSDFEVGTREQKIL